jgi:hypothetical protein
LGDFLNGFIGAYNQKDHIHYLMDERTIMICFHTEKGEFSLTLNNNKATALEEYGQVDQLEIVNIAGDHKKVADLLTGKIKLRESISNQYLTISSTLRTTLALESIFFLANKENPSFLVG